MHAWTTRSASSRPSTVAASPSSRTRKATAARASASRPRLPSSPARVKRRTASTPTRRAWCGPPSRAFSPPPARATWNTGCCSSSTTSTPTSRSTSSRTCSHASTTRIPSLTSRASSPAARTSSICTTASTSATSGHLTIAASQPFLLTRFPSSRRCRRPSSHLRRCRQCRPLSRRRRRRRPHRRGRRRSRPPPLPPPARHPSRRRSRRARHRRSHRHLPRRSPLPPPPPRRYRPCRQCLPRCGGRDGWRRSCPAPAHPAHATAGASYGRRRSHRGPGTPRRFHRGPPCRYHHAPPRWYLRGGRATPRRKQRGEGRRCSLRRRCPLRIGGGRHPHGRNRRRRNRRRPFARACDGGLPGRAAGGAGPWDASSGGEAERALALPTEAAAASDLRARPPQRRSARLDTPGTAHRLFMSRGQFCGQSGRLGTLRL
mmetsp:Transcript_471/g.1362  ORF Transcript_471/g.1362 Transcript_471/m.1362 type:complete len:431 (+) Transcript_471:2967-4259(+)